MSLSRVTSAPLQKKKGWQRWLWHEEEERKREMKREKERERCGVDSPSREARLDAVPEGLSVTNDRDAMHTQTDQGHDDVWRKEKRKKKIFIKYLRVD